MFHVSYYYLVIILIKFSLVMIKFVIVFRCHIIGQFLFQVSKKMGESYARGVQPLF